MNLKNIRPNPNNPRYITADQFRLLVESIKRDADFLRVRPVAHAGGYAYGGNQRYEAICEAVKDPAFCERWGITGPDTVPDEWFVDVSEWDADRIARFVVVDNSPRGMSGEWDWDMLANEWDDDLLAGLGVSVPSIDETDYKNLFTDNINDNKKQQEQKKVCPNCGCVLT